MTSPEELQRMERMMKQMSTEDLRALARFLIAEFDLEDDNQPIMLIIKERDE